MNRITLNTGNKIFIISHRIVRDRSVLSKYDVCNLEKKHIGKKKLYMENKMFKNKVKEAKGNYQTDKIRKEYET